MKADTQRDDSFERFYTVLEQISTMLYTAE